VKPPCVNSEFVLKVHSWFALDVEVEFAFSLSIPPKLVKGPAFAEALVWKYAQAPFSSGSSTVAFHHPGQPNLLFSDRDPDSGSC
jgi:hypothetical protein